MASGYHIEHHRLAPPLSLRPLASCRLPRPRAIPRILQDRHSLFFPPFLLHIYLLVHLQSPSLPSEQRIPPWKSCLPQPGGRLSSLPLPSCLLAAHISLLLCLLSVHCHHHSRKTSLHFPLGPTLYNWSPAPTPTSRCPCQGYQRRPCCQMQADTSAHILLSLSASDTVG